MNKIKTFAISVCLLFVNSISVLADGGTPIANRDGDTPIANIIGYLYDALGNIIGYLFG